MKTIHKFSLEVFNESTVVACSSPLTVQLQYDEVTLWALVDTEESSTKAFIFYVYGTGFEFDDEGLIYLGTVQQKYFVWHIFFKEVE